MRPHLHRALAGQYGCIGMGLSCVSRNTLRGAIFRFVLPADAAASEYKTVIMHRGTRIPFEALSGAHAVWSGGAYYHLVRWMLFCV